MLRHRTVIVVCTFLLLAATARSASAQASAAMAAAAKASPELVAMLAKEIGASPDASAGAAGALFGLAKSRLKADEFSQVSKAVPGMDSLLAAAPALGAMSGVGGGAAGLASMAASFSKLGLKPEMVTKAASTLVAYVTKSGGANVGSLLAGVLK